LGETFQATSRRSLFWFYVLPTPRLNGYSKGHLPICWDYKKTWMFSTIFSRWLSMYALPAWKDYRAKETVDIKTPLIDSILQSCLTLLICTVMLKSFSFCSRLKLGPRSWSWSLGFCCWSQVSEG
jgi:hypothetical protein